MDLSKSAQARTDCLGEREYGKESSSKPKRTDKFTQLSIDVSWQRLRSREVSNRSMNQTGDQAESQKRSCAAVASQLHSQTHFEDYLKKRSQDCDAFGDWR